MSHHNHPHPVHTVQKAGIGRVIHVIGKGVHSNGAEVAPALITRVWGEPDATGKQLVNATIFPDLGKPHPQGSIHIHPSREKAHEAVTRELGADPIAAFWPERT